MRYKTVYSHGLDEHIEKKSRFIGQAFPVSSEEEARVLIEQIKKQYWDASHTVFAYRIRENERITARFSDAGEPSGTAGKPTLDVVEGNDLVNVLVTVTRYFGGTLLGTGGLVRAYSKGAKIAVESAKIIEKTEYRRMVVSMEYTDLGKIQYKVEEAHFPIERIDYTDKAAVHVLVEPEEEMHFEKMLTEASDGRLVSEKNEVVWGAEIDGKLRILEE